MSKMMLCDSCGRVIRDLDGDYLTVNTTNLWDEDTLVMVEGGKDYETTKHCKKRETFHYCEFCKRYALDALKSVRALSRENLESMRVERVREVAQWYGICLSKNGKQKHKDELIEELMANDMHGRGIE